MKRKDKMTNRPIAEIDAEISRIKEALANVKGSETEVYARIVGYYRSVRNWNKGKRDEYDHRKMFLHDYEFVPNKTMTETNVAVAESNLVSSKNPVRYEFFARSTCPNCPPVKEYISNTAIVGKLFDVDTESGFNRASELGIIAAPTVVLFNEYDAEIGRAYNTIELASFFEKEPALC